MEIAIDFDVSHHDRQHFLVDVNSRDPVRHWWLDSISPLPQGYCDRSPIFIAFRGPQAQANQLRTSSSAASQPNKSNKISDLQG